jgi:hypothetical protein
LLPNIFHIKTSFQNFPNSIIANQLCPLFPLFTFFGSSPSASFKKSSIFWSVQCVKSFATLRKAKSAINLKSKPLLRILPTAPKEYTTRIADQLLAYLEQARKETDEGVPVLERKAETAEVIVPQEETGTMSAVHQEAAYYEALIEDYFSNDNPAILEELGVSSPPS